jgi:hypothetical protein
MRLSRGAAKLARAWPCGHVTIEGATGVMTVPLKDMDDNVLWSRKLDPVKP